MKRRIGICLLLGVFAAAPVRAQEVSKQFEDFHLQGYDGQGGKTWEVKGRTADILGDTIAIRDVDANHYGDQTINLKADEGIVDKTGGNLKLRKNVRITSSEGGRLTTDSLEWKKDENLVTTEDRVDLTDRRLNASGTGMTARTDFHRVEMKKDVTVRMTMDAEEPPVVVTCDGPLEIDQRGNKAVFNDNVVARQKDRTLEADVVEIFFDSEKKRIEKMVCRGHVVIERGGSVSYADKAVYTASDGKVVLSGRPKLIMRPGDFSESPPGK